MNTKEKMLNKCIKTRFFFNLNKIFKKLFIDSCI